ncbi:MAG: DUF3060 domain-containing protein [Candidatus Eremiobacterota bacterium]
MRNLILALALIGIVSGACLADTYNLAGNNLNKEMTLTTEDTVNLMGNHNTVTVRGTGDVINLMGNHNTVILDGVVEVVNLTGNHNTLKIIQASGRPRPHVNEMGSDNKVLMETR